MDANQVLLALNSVLLPLLTLNSRQPMQNSFLNPPLAVDQHGNVNQDTTNQQENNQQMTSQQEENQHINNTTDLNTIMHQSMNTMSNKPKIEIEMDWSDNSPTVSF